jgi:hypothetical protein
VNRIVRMRDGEIVEEQMMEVRDARATHAA